MNASSHIIYRHITCRVKLRVYPRLGGIVSLGYHYDMVSILLNIRVDTSSSIEVNVVVNRSDFKFNHNQGARVIVGILIVRNAY